MITHKKERDQRVEKALWKGISQPFTASQREEVSKAVTTHGMNRRKIVRGLKRHKNEMKKSRNRKKRRKMCSRR